MSANEALYDCRHLLDEPHQNSTTFSALIPPEEIQWSMLMYVYANRNKHINFQAISINHFLVDSVSYALPRSNEQGVSQQ